MSGTQEHKVSYVDSDKSNEGRVCACCPYRLAYTPLLLESPCLCLLVKGGKCSHLLEVRGDYDKHWPCL